MWSFPSPPLERQLTERGGLECFTPRQLGPSHLSVATVRMWEAEGKSVGFCLRGTRKQTRPGGRQLWLAGFETGTNLVWICSF